MKLDPDKDLSFWDFTFDEIGRYDIPATIDFITSKINVAKITYIGHSEGTTQMFSGMANNIAYYNSKLNGFVALGPITNLKYTTSWLLQMAIKVHLDTLVKFLGVNEILRGPEYTDPILGYFCQWFSFACDGVLSLIADSNPQDDDPEKLVHYLSHFPSGTSTKTLQHFAQLNRKGEFIKFDYGKEENIKKYGQATPPVYDIRLIKEIPICMLFGSDDHLSDQKDNTWAKEILEKNNVLYKFREYEKVGHLTYFIPKDDRHLVDTLDCVRYFNQ